MAHYCRAVTKSLRGTGIFLSEVHTAAHRHIVYSLCLGVERIKEAHIPTRATASRDGIHGIHANTILLRFLVIILRFLSLRSILELSFLHWLIVLIGFFWNHRGGMVSGFPPFGAFLIVVSMGKRSIYILINCNKRKNHATFQEQRDNVYKSKPPHTFICWCRNHESKKTKAGCKCNITAGGGDCE